MGKLQLRIVGDTTQLTTTTNADQTTIRFKILDKDAVSLLEPTKKLFLVSYAVPLVQSPLQLGPSPLPNN